MKNRSHLILFIFGFSLVAQSVPSGNLTLDEIAIQLNGLNVNGLLREDQEGNASLSIGLLKFGFNNIRASTSKDTNKQYISFTIGGPNIDLNEFELSVRSEFPNFFHSILTELADHRVEVPTDGLTILEKAIDVYFNENGRFPGSFNELAVKSYILINKYPFNQQKWVYELDLPNNIRSVTTSFHHARFRRTLILDWNSRKIMGLESENYSKESIPWNFNLNVNKVEQKLFSDIKVIIGPDISNIEFTQKKARLQLKGINISAIPKSEMVDQARFRLSDVILEITNLVMETQKIGDSPRVYNGTGQFTLRNFEIKIPSLLSSDEDIANIAEKLGIKNGLFRVRQVDLKLTLKDDRFGEIHAMFVAPFLKINLDGEFSYSQIESDPNVYLQNMVLKINPISYGVRDLILNWEKENEQSLPRQGATIILKLDGSMDDPIIHGLDLNRLN